MEVKSFTLVNLDKFARALNGSPINENDVAGGVGAGAYFEDGWKRDGDYITAPEAEKLEHALLAEYDRIGGLVKKGSDKVKTGSFYDFKAKCPRAVAKVVFVFWVNGKSVEVPDGVELPGIVKAAKVLEESSDDAFSPEETDEAPKKKKAKK